MGAHNIIMLKKTSFLIFLGLSAFIFSTSFAGRAIVHYNLEKAVDVDATPQEAPFDSRHARRELASQTKLLTWKIPQYETFRHEDDIIHKRLLRMNTKDYGRYDPAPALVKPPFKLIPN